MSIKQPSGAVVSAHAFPSDLKPACLLVIAASSLSKSRVDTRQAIQPCHHDHVTLANKAYEPVKLRPIRLGSAGSFPEHFHRTSFGVR